MKNLAVHATIKDFIATGLSEQQAEQIVTDIIMIVQDEVNSLDKDQSHLATKADIVELKGDIAEFRAELKGDIAELRAELKGDIAEFKKEVKTTFATKDDLKIAVGGLERDMKWVMAIGVGILICAIKLAFS